MKMFPLQTTKVGVFLVALLSAGVTAIGQTQPPTEQELQKMYDQKEYRTCLQQTARVMQLKGDAANGYNLFTLQMRRGECFLHLGDWGSAPIAYHAAAKAAPTAAEAEQARAMELLVKASRGGKYDPVKTTGNPISIISEATRKEAMMALFVDQFAAATGEIKAAQNSTSLVPIIKFVPRAQDLHAIETAGYGVDTQSGPVLAAIGELARGMIVTELKSKDAIISGVQNRANTLASSGFNWVTAVDGSELLVADTRVGLSSNDRDLLRQMIPYLGDLLEATQRGKKVALSLGKDGTAWDPVVAQAKTVAERAQNVLDAE